MRGITEINIIKNDLNAQRNMLLSEIRSIDSLFVVQILRKLNKLYNGKDTDLYDSFIYELYEDDEKYLKENRFVLGLKCPYCLSYKCNNLKGVTNRVKCYCCRRQFGLKVGTIMHESKLTWYEWVNIFVHYVIGCSTHELARESDLTQKTAWHAYKRIDKLLIEKDNTLYKLLRNKKD